MGLPCAATCTQSLEHVPQTLTGTKFLMVVEPGTPDIDDILRTLCAPCPYCAQMVVSGLPFHMIHCTFGHHQPACAEEGVRRAVPS